MRQDNRAPLMFALMLITLLVCTVPMWVLQWPKPAPPFAGITDPTMWCPIGMEPRTILNDQQEARYAIATRDGIEVWRGVAPGFGGMRVCLRPAWALTLRSMGQKLDGR